MFPKGSVMFECANCKYRTTRERDLRRHLARKRPCEPAKRTPHVEDSVQSRTCQQGCGKLFASRMSRNNHHKYVRCLSVAPQSTDAPSVSNMTNNTNNIYNDHCTINNTNNITVRFGEEVLERLVTEPDYMKRMEEVIRLGKYALPQHLNDIYFNEAYPMNNTIIKTRHNDRFVKIKTGRDQWDIRAVDDVYKSLINKMESYMSPYFAYMEKEMQSIYDRDIQRFRRMTRSIREYGHKVLWLDWKCDDIRQIGVDLNDAYDEGERARRIQEMKSMLLEHIYDKSREVLAI